jgi:hypothetical protein
MPEDGLKSFSPLGALHHFAMTNASNLELKHSCGLTALTRLEICLCENVKDEVCD